MKTLAFLPLPCHNLRTLFPPRKQHGKWIFFLWIFSLGCPFILQELFSFSNSICLDEPVPNFVYYALHNTFLFAPWRERKSEKMESREFVAQTQLVREVSKKNLFDIKNFHCWCFTDGRLVVSCLVPCPMDEIENNFFSSVHTWMNFGVYV
jgi:hypothetical protein